MKKKIYCISWSTPGACYSQTFDTPEERDEFRRMWILPRYPVQTWERIVEVRS